MNKPTPTSPSQKPPKALALFDEAGKPVGQAAQRERETERQRERERDCLSDWLNFNYASIKV